MPGVPPALALMVACGSLVTSVKSSWELSRMARKKLSEANMDSELASLHRKLRRAYENGHITRAEHDKWFDVLVAAKAEKDVPALRKVRAHLRIAWEKAQKADDEKRCSSRSPTRSHHGSSSSRSGDRPTRRNTVGYDRHRGVEWPNSAGTIGWRGDERPASRMQRRSSMSYARNNVNNNNNKDSSNSDRDRESDDGRVRFSAKRSVSSPRYHHRRGDGRGSKFRDDEGYYDDEDTETSYTEKRGRGRQ